MIHRLILKESHRGISPSMISSEEDVDTERDLHVARRKEEFRKG